MAFIAAQYTFSFSFFFVLPLIRAQSGAAHSCVLAGLVLRSAGGHEPNSGYWC